MDQEHLRLVVAGCMSIMFLAGCGPTLPPGVLKVDKALSPEHPDMSIALPNFGDGALQIDAIVDGYTLQAIRIAADDYLTPSTVDRPCERRQPAYGYRALRKGDIIFVRIDFKPENCGAPIDMLDGGATYAISTDGRILRRALDGREPLSSMR